MKLTLQVFEINIQTISLHVKYLAVKFLSDLLEFSSQRAEPQPMGSRATPNTVDGFSSTQELFW